MWVLFLAEIGWWSRPLPVADEGRRKKGKLQADKRGFQPVAVRADNFSGPDLLPSLATNSPLDCLLNAAALSGSNPITIQRKTPITKWWVFFLAEIEGLPPLPAANAIWPRLVRSALSPKNSVLHCFFNGETLTGSNPLQFFITNKNSRHIK